MSGKPGKVYVGGIGGDVTRDELEREYGKYGRLRDVWVARNPPGFAFVEFIDDRDADEAIRCTDGKKICGYRVNVQASHGKLSKRKREMEETRCHKCSRWGHNASVCTRYPGDRRRSRSPRRDYSPRRSPPRRNYSARDRSPRRDYRRRTRSRSPRYRRRSRSPLPRRSRSPITRASRSPIERKSPARRPRSSPRRSRPSTRPRTRSHEGDESPVKKRRESEDRDMSGSPVSRDGSPVHVFSPQSVENVSQSPTPQRSVEGSVTPDKSKRSERSLRSSSPEGF